MQDKAIDLLLRQSKALQSKVNDLSWAAREVYDHAGGIEDDAMRDRALGKTEQVFQLLDEASNILASLRMEADIFSSLPNDSKEG